MIATKDTTEVMPNPHEELRQFELTDAHIAKRPPERRGLARDEVRMLITNATSGASQHARLRDLPAFLRPGDLVVLNDSQTLPAALECSRSDGSPALLHLSTHLGGRFWSGELRKKPSVGSRPLSNSRAGERLQLAGGAEAVLEAPYRRAEDREQRRLWRVRLELCGSLFDYLEEHGGPIRYDYVEDNWPIEDYRTPVGAALGSAEMPSAGRGFTHRLLSGLTERGVQLASVTLHTGVSSLESGEPPYPEWFEVSALTAATVASTRSRGGRIIAVGTTVVRALESAATTDGIAPASGWTELVITPESKPAVVDGLLTGLHEPKSSHLAMLAAFSAPDKLAVAYDEALAREYLWHEFGDVQLIAPVQPT